MANEANWMTSSGKPTSSNNRSTWTHTHAHTLKGPAAHWCNIRAIISLFFSDNCLPTVTFLSHFQVNSVLVLRWAPCCSSANVGWRRRPPRPRCPSASWESPPSPPPSLPPGNTAEPEEHRGTVVITRDTRRRLPELFRLPTHLLTLPVGQVALSQHEATGADVHLTPGTDQPHVLLHTQGKPILWRLPAALSDPFQWEQASECSRMTHLQLCILTVGHQTLWELETRVTGPTGREKLRFYQPDKTVKSYYRNYPSMELIQELHLSNDCYFVCSAQSEIWLGETVGTITQHEEWSLWHNMLK